MTLSKLRNYQTACAVLLLCTATAIATPARTFLTLVNFNGTDGARWSKPFPSRPSRERASSSSATT
jgi:hypothetical protein